MGKVMALLLAGMLLALPPCPVAAAPPSSHSQPVEERSPRDRRLWLILGSTVLGVTGMWTALYRRGKK